MEYLLGLAYIAMVLLIGTLASALAYSIKISDIFILLLTGMILGNFGVLRFDTDFIVIVSIFAVIFLVFTNSFAFKPKMVEKYIFPSLKLTIVNLVLCLFVLTLSMMFIFNLEFTLQNILIAALFSLAAYDTDPSAVMPMLKGIKNKLTDLIEIESIINTPIMIIPSFIILNSLAGSNAKALSLLNNPVSSFFQLIIVAVLVAFIASWITISILKNNYFGDLTHLAVLTSAILVYAGTEFLGGSGVLSIAIYGILFGTSHISHLIEIEKFESILTNSIKIITFMLLGTILIIKSEYIIKGTLLFLIYILLRFASAVLALRKEKITFKQSVFVALNVPKGIDVALVLLLTISLYSGIKNIEIAINLVMILILYSIALSAAASPFSQYLLGEKKNVKKI